MQPNPNPQTSQKQRILLIRFTLIDYRGVSLNRELTGDNNGIFY
jgi:hypothetical protein